MTIGCRYLISTLKVFAFSFIIIFYVFSSFICKIWRHRADFANWWKVLDAFISGVQGIKLIGKTVSDESYTLWFHVSSKVNTFTQIRTALVGRPYRETNVLEIAVNSREFQRIVVLVLFLSSTFSDTIHWQNTNSSNLSNNWFFILAPFDSHVFHICMFLAIHEIWILKCAPTLIRSKFKIVTFLTKNKVDDL